MAVTFEGYERREAKTSAIMKQYGIKDFDDALKICTDKGFNPYKITEGIQNICFETLNGRTLSAAQSQSRKAAPRLPTPLAQ